MTINFAEIDFPAINVGDTVIFDVETTGLDWKTCTPCGYVVTVERNDHPVSYYYPIRHETGPNLDAEEIVNWIKSWCEKPIHLVGHNIKFDLHFAANDGIYFKNATIEDTQINGGLINEHSKSFSLDALARDYGAPAKKGEELYAHMAKLFGGPADRKQMANFWRLSADDFLALDYATGDGDSTYYLWKNQQPLIDHEDLRRVWKLECRVLPVLFRMERRGVKVDMERFEFMKKWLDKKIEEATKALPWEGFNVRSTVQICKAFEDIGVTDWPKTPIGNASFVEEWLKKSELGQNIVTLRKLTNLRNTFIEGAVEANLHNGRIHCNFNQLRADEYGTITGRLSCNGPNMQQIPKRDKLLAPLFRSIFVPDDGCYWSSNDYSQQEYRVFAVYSNSKRLIQNYVDGIDMHQSVADMLGVERDPTAKRLNLGMLYWMGVPKLAAQLGVLHARAKELREEYFAMVPEVKGLLKACQKKGESAGFIRTILGRRARFPKRDEAYKGLSRVIQGTCADITKERMVEVDEYLNKVSDGKLGIQLQIHDSFDFSIPIGQEHIDIECHRIMQDFSDHEPLTRLPMIVDRGRGTNWGEASFPKCDWSVYNG